MADPVVATVVSIPSRVSGLKAVVDVVSPQVDRLNVYLNGYRTVPSFLKSTSIVVARSEDHGDRMDASKFWWSTELRQLGCYHFTLDDDIDYPSNYVSRLKSAIDRYDRRAIVGVLGMLYPGEITNPYGSGRRMFSFWAHLARDTIVNMIGTGTMAYHTGTMPIRWQDFPMQLMPDPGVAITAQRCRVPMVIVARRGQWLRARREGEISPLYRTRRRDEHALKERQKAMQSCGRWKVFPLPMPLAALEARRAHASTRSPANMPKTKQRHYPRARRYLRLRHRR